MARSRAAVKTAYIGDSAARYDIKRFSSLSGRAYDEMEMQEFVRVLRRIPVGSRILEVGCGTGRFCELGLELGYDVWAVDPSEDMVQIAKKRCSRFSWDQVIIVDGRSLPFVDGFFEIAFAIRVLNQTGSKGNALAVVEEMTRVVKKGGIVLVDFANRWRPFAERRKGTFFCVSDLEEFAEQIGKVNVEAVHGILFLSATLLHKIPPFLINPFIFFDRLLSRMFPRFCSRPFVSFRKNETASN